MRGKGKEEELMYKEQNSENWCFVCKDGGALRICDHKRCPKSYHHFCLRKDKSFLESEKKWDCAWHRCSICRKSSHLHCYTCTNSVCRYCLSTEHILQVKGQYGFCEYCLKLALLIEEKRDYDSDGGKVDFTDRETCEGLHMEYYMIIKEDEGFELADIYAAKESAKAKTSHKGEAKSGSKDFDDEEEGPISDYDDLEVRKKKPRSNGRKPAKRTQAKSDKNQFIGWASRALVEFLGSIGKSTDEKLSHPDVVSIVNEYVKEKKLTHPEKKKFVMCDARLYSLFRRKKINKSRIDDLLEDHFAENHKEESEDDDDSEPDSEDDLGTPSPLKRQRKMGADKNSGVKRDFENKYPLKSRFASIVVENMKLVCLGRGVLKEMLKEAETFKEKVTGCFVRVKTDPYDRRSKSHQLVKVKGVKTVLVDYILETVLLLSDVPNEIPIPLVSDEGITEEEVEDLRKKVMTGEIERPTVEYLQKKVIDIHKDKTNLSISKELKLLQNLIERANEKGWRRDMFEHLERKKILESETEQSRLLENVPTVIADAYEPDRDSEGVENVLRSDEGFPEQQDDKALGEGSSRDGQISTLEKDQAVSDPKEPKQGLTPDSELKHSKAKDCDEEEKDSKARHRVPTNYDDGTDGTWCMKGPDGVVHESVSVCMLRSLNECCPSTAVEFKVWRENEREEDAKPLPEALVIAARK